MSHPKYAHLTCAHCQNMHTVEVEQDEDGCFYAGIETERCSQEGCRAKLCEACLQARCSFCERLYCTEHMTEVPDGDKPLVLCPVCLKNLRDVEATEAA